MGKKLKEKFIFMVTAIGIVLGIDLNYLPISRNPLVSGIIEFLAGACNSSC